MDNSTAYTGTSTEIDTGDLHQLSPIELVFWFTIYAIIAVLAVGGNLLVLFIIATRPRMRSVTNYFIANLAIGDFLTGLLAIPFKFQAALFQEWFLPAFTCKTATFSETVSLSVSVFTLTCIAADRFRAIVSPQSKKMSRQTALAIIAVIWIFSFTQSLPFGLFHQKTLYTFGGAPAGLNHSITLPSNGNGTYSIDIQMISAIIDTSRPNASNHSDVFRTYQCVAVYGDVLWWNVYNVYLTVITYFVPLFIVDLCYCVIAYLVWSTNPVPMPPLNDSMPFAQHVVIANNSRRSSPSVVTRLLKPTTADSQTLAFERSKRKVVKMLCVVVLVFTFCWLPYETYLVLNEVRPRINDWQYINVLFFACHWLAMSNSCLNPIIYGIYNEKFQFEYANVLLRCCGARWRPRRSGVDNNNDDDEAMTSRGLQTTTRNTVPSLHSRSPLKRAVDADRSTQKSSSTRLVCIHYVAAELGRD